MTNKVLALILIFSLAFNIAFVGIWAYGQFYAPDRVRPRPPRRAPWERMGLTEPQRRELVERRRQLQGEMSRVRAELEEQRARLFDLLEAEHIDEEAVRDARERMKRAQEKVQQLVFRHMRELRDVLKPEQRRRMMDMMRRHGAGRHRGGTHDGGRWEGGMGGGRHGPMHSGRQEDW